MLPVLALALAATATAGVPTGNGMLQLYSNPNLHVRHCMFQAFAVAGYPGDQQDFNFSFVGGACRGRRPSPHTASLCEPLRVCAALNGASSAVSIESMNYPGNYLSVCTSGGLEPGRLCLQANGAFDDNDGSFEVVPGMADSSLYSFKSMSSVGGHTFAFHRGPLVVTRFPPCSAPHAARRRCTRVHSSQSTTS